MEVGGCPHNPAALPQGKYPRYLLSKWWLGRIADLLHPYVMVDMSPYLVVVF
jgi:hypothetical protein